MAKVFDTETDGLLPELTTIHCLIIKDLTTGLIERYNDQGEGCLSVEEGARNLMYYASQGELVIGHNAIGFDVLALKKVYAWFYLDHKIIRDTLVYARTLWPDLKRTDMNLVKRKQLPAKLLKKHSLEAWGYRLGNFKGDYEGDPAIADPKERAARKWERWNQPMEDYCVQDVEVCAALYARCLRSHHSDLAVDTEHAVAWIIGRQERYGFAFDQERAVKLYGKLAQRKVELEAALKAAFAPFYMPGKTFTPKRDNKTRGYSAGVPFVKMELVEFNPGSRDHIVNRLRVLYGWQPELFTPDGKPQMDEAVIESLDDVPQKALLSEYFLVSKRIGQVAEGKEAWLKKVAADGRIHGALNPNGAVTARMSHFSPNVSQVPAVYSPYGEECRGCFVASPRKVLVGSDADSLELRCLAGYMAAFDDGAFVETILKGDKTKGTDMHSVNARALGLDPTGICLVEQTGRDVAKTFVYAFLYGAGETKLGSILTGRRDASAEGKRGRDKFLRNLPALKKLVDAVKTKAKTKGFLLGLDKRRVEVRSQHASLNTLLQSAGAILMKHSLVILDNNLQSIGMLPGVDYEFVANIHDEFQIETTPELADQIGQASAEAMRLAGESLGFCCPIAGNFEVGNDWAHTH